MNGLILAGNRVLRLLGTEANQRDALHAIGQRVRRARCGLVENGELGSLRQADMRRLRCVHEWTFTGTDYGGDDERWHGEGRSYCAHCGADGDA